MTMYSCSWGYGLHWLKEAWNLFKRAPLTWLLSGVVCGVIFAIPEVFSARLTHSVIQLIVLWFSSLLAGGMITMAYRCDQGYAIQLKELLAGFSFIKPLTIIQLIGFGFLFSTLLFCIILFAFKIPLVSFILLIGLIIGGFIFCGLFWFASILIVLGKQTPWLAMKTSLSGCLKSWRAWTVVYFGMLIVWMIFYFALILLGVLLLSMGWSSMAQLETLFIPLSALMFPVHSLLLYVAYRDVFGQGEAFLGD